MHYTNQIHEHISIKHLWLVRKKLLLMDVAKNLLNIFLKP